MFLETWDAFLVVIGLVSLLFLYGRWEDGFFERKGVKSPTTYFPFVGHMMDVLRRKEHFMDLSKRLYNEFPNEKYVGFRQFMTPLVIIKDLEVLKQVTIKDFDHFTDHLGVIDENSDPLFGKNLFALRGQKWRDMRATLSPAFTSSKMRGMFQYVVEIAEQLTDFYVEQSKKPENKGKALIEVEMKDAFTRYTNDVIANTAFGLKVNSLEDRDNQFYAKGKEATNFSGITLIKFFGIMSVPKLMKFFRTSLFSSSVKKFFRNLVADTMEAREKNNIVRNDMIQLLMEAKTGSLKYEETVGEDTKEAGFATVEESAVGKETIKRKWTDDDITAQAVLFFIAGFETSSTLLCFLTHEITLHPEEQERLREEVDEVAASSGGTVSYNDLQSMKYMDMVVSETLRYWPPAPAMDRRCIKTYTLPPSNSNSKPVVLNPDEGIWMPIYGIHHDPKYYKDPERFDPERFSDENKGNIVPNSFIPFGMGPRNCIGSRFALMEAKAVIFHLLHKFELVQIPKTQNPIQLKKDTFNLHAEKGFWVGLKPRSVAKV